MELGASTMNAFLHKFCEVFALSFYEKFINVYKDGVDLERLHDGGYEYLPGCIGSTDGFHILWDMCPAQKRNLYKGRYDYPSIAFNVTTDHKYRIIGVSGGHPGSNADKTIVQYDGLVDRVRNNENFTNHTYELYTKDGTTRLVRGCYFICDQGYHRWNVLQNTDPDALSVEERTLSRYIECLRKDVECTFGQLVKRFRILKIPFLFHERSRVENVVFACMILHNFLIAVNDRLYDNMDLLKDRYEELGVDFDLTDDDHDSLYNPLSFLLQASAKDDEKVEADKGNSYHELRKHLAEHVYFLFSKGWLST
jgi:hypothetical protein